MDFPCTIEEYFNEAIKPCNIIPKVYRRNFRVVPAKKFMDFFASDRRHMKAKDGSWQSPPPSYPPIQGRKSKFAYNLNFYVNMEVQMAPKMDETDDDEPRADLGQILNDSYEFLAFFSKCV